MPLPHRGDVRRRRAVGGARVDERQPQRGNRRGRGDEADEPDAFHAPIIPERGKLKSKALGFMPPGANRVAAMERITEAGAVFETDHRGCSAMKHHRHGSSFVTLVLGGAYVEVCDMIPALCRSGSIVVHDAAEEHADRFASDTRCLNVELPHDSRS